MKGNTECAKAGNGDTSGLPLEVPARWLTAAEEAAIEAEFQALLEDARKITPRPDPTVLRTAFEFAHERHSGQRRDSGEPYIVHPLAVARIVASLGLDQVSLVSALCHDILEMTPTTREEMERRFGSEVLRVVEGVTKVEYHVSKISLGETGQQEAAQPAAEGATVSPRAEVRSSGRIANLRHFILAMVEDLRVIPVKLADRLHNMRTLDAKDAQARARIALETEQIYAPLAHRVGIWQLKWELEDLAFKHRQPAEYRRVAELVEQTRAERQKEVDEAVRILRDHLHARGLTNAHVTGRAKHLYSVYRKMVTQNLAITDIYDLVAIRVIVDTRAQCYEAFGYVSEIWPSIPNTFADYIANRKSNLYQSLHVKVRGPQGKPIEIQIRTWDMHRTAEFGLAAHWAYKEAGDEGKASADADRRISQLRRMLFELAQEPSDTDFYRTVLQDLFGDHVIVFTPKGDPIELPKGATVLDFAYRIHTDVGTHAIGARIGGRFVDLSHECRSGDTIEVVTRSSNTPSLDWLTIAKTTYARSKIKGYFRKLTFDDNVVRGRAVLQAEAERAGVEPQRLRDESLQEIAPSLNHVGARELLAAIGNGTLSVHRVVRKLAPAAQPSHPGGARSRLRLGNAAGLEVSLDGTTNVHYARCAACFPIPGDNVVGYSSRLGTLKLHRAECTELARLADAEPERILRDVVYAGRLGQKFIVRMLVYGTDRVGLLADVSRVISDTGVNIRSNRTYTRRSGRAVLEYMIEVPNTEEYNLLAQRITALADVLSVERPAGSIGKRE